MAIHMKIIQNLIFLSFLLTHPCITSMNQVAPEEIVPIADEVIQAEIALIHEIKDVNNNPIKNNYSYFVSVCNENDPLSFILNDRRASVTGLQLKEEIRQGHVPRNGTLVITEKNTSSLTGWLFNRFFGYSDRL